jgi:antitoxin component YwqK of YwqJK toxin-antitoxin module
MHGTQTNWFPDGNIKEIQEFRNGVSTGCMSSWYENGKRKKSVTSDKTESWNINGQLEYQEIRKNGKSYIRKWNSGGILQQKYVMVRGYVEGRWYIYSDDGWLSCTEDHYYGGLHGYLIRYDRLGRIIEKTKYANGMRHGTSIIPDYEFGNPTRVTQYRFGTCVKDDLKK